MRKRLASWFLVILLFCLPALAEDFTWEEWTQLDTGIWQRSGTRMMEGGVILKEQQAEGPNADELIITQDFNREYNEEGVLQISNRTVYDTAGNLKLIENYEFNQAGVLIRGAITRYNEGKVEKILAGIFTLRDDGSFKTQINVLEGNEPEPLVFHLEYEKDGTFISITQCNSNTGQYEQADYEMESDPFRDTWLKVNQEVKTGS
ncbi:MAG: hypothetical protein GXZ04_01140 [Clostridiales bacterium]|nr:hypothetical protein [Clostridiales bacterium]